MRCCAEVREGYGNVGQWGTSRRVVSGWVRLLCAGWLSRLLRVSKVKHLELVVGSLSRAGSVSFGRGLAGVGSR